VHWLAYKKPEQREDLVLRSSLLAFHPVYGKHTGANLAELLYQLLARAEVSGGNVRALTVSYTFQRHDYCQGAHWTLDMASTNDAMLDSLGKLYKLRAPGVSFNQNQTRVLCFPHVVNICCQHVIKHLNRCITDDAGDDPADDDDGTVDDNGDDEGDDNEYNDDDNDNDGDDGNGDPESTLRASRGLLGKVRALVRGIRASGQRQQAFVKVIVGGNQYGWWKGPDDKVISLKAKKLILDVRTRWDSTYQMLTRFLELRQVGP
jgi:hypothetical protein